MAWLRHCPLWRTKPVKLREILQQNKFNYSYAYMHFSTRVYQPRRLLLWRGHLGCQSKGRQCGFAIHSAMGDEAHHQARHRPN